MRILIYGINYTPELTGIGKYSGEMAEWLASKGHDIRVVTAPPYYPDWKVFKNYAAWQYRTERTSGVKIYRCPVWVPRIPKGIYRIFHLASFAVSSIPIMLQQIYWRPSIVIVVEPPLFCAPLTLLVARACRAKTILHIQDFEIDAAFDLGLLSSEKLRKVITKMEKWVMKRFDRVTTISDKMMERATSKGVDDKKCILFPNWVDTTSIFPLSDTNPFRTELGIDKQVVVFLYSGSMGEKQGLEIITDAARQLLADARLLFVMYSQDRSLTRTRSLATGLNNIIWIPLQPLDKLNNLLNLADVHLLPQRKDAADLVMPSKLTGMLSSEKSILATAAVGTQIEKIVKSTGIVVPPEDSKAFVNAILKFVNDEKFRAAKGEAAREYAEHKLDKQIILQSFNKSLAELMK